jgi:pumilio RNA-binding family
MSVAPSDTLQSISSRIVDDALRLADDQYGNYVLQHLLELGPTVQLKRLRAALKGKYAELSRRKCASNVVEKSLKTRYLERGPCFPASRARAQRL